MINYITYSKFVQLYRKYGKCINQVSPIKKPFNEEQLKYRYEKYLASEKKKYEKINKKIDKNIAIDEKWEALKIKIKERDLGRCRLCFILGNIEYNELKNNAGHLFTAIDSAHIFGKGIFPDFKYDEDNIILLNRYSHSMLDSSRNPINGNSINEEEKEAWWRRIIGKESFEILKKKVYNISVYK